MNASRWYWLAAITRRGGGGGGPWRSAASVLAFTPQQIDEALGRWQDEFRGR